MCLWLRQVEIVRVCAVVGAKCIGRLHNCLLLTVYTHPYKHHSQRSPLHTQIFCIQMTKQTNTHTHTYLYE